MRSESIAHEVRAIDSEAAMRARGIIILVRSLYVKSNQLVKNIEIKQL